jgi:hypothetical protein
LEVGTSQKVHERPPKRGMSKVSIRITKRRTPPHLIRTTWFFIEQ